jgi:hypothetical protein
MKSAWTKRPWASALLCFAGRPSTLLHESRIRALIPESAQLLLSRAQPGTRLWHSIHRHWSIALNKSLALPPLEPSEQVLTDPSLPMALLQPVQLEKLQQFAGAMLAGQLIRRTIRRDHQQLLLQTLGDPVYRFALTRAPAIYAGLPQTQTVDSHQLARDVTEWGNSLIRRAVQAAPSAIADRFLLRLPQETPEPRQQPLPADLEAPQALELVNSLIEMMDPQWLSSFRAPA